MSVGTTTPASTPGSRRKAVALRVAAALLGCLFVLSGAMKFVIPDAAEQFARYGYPDWFRVLIGVVEVGGGLLLLVPRTTFYAAAALAVIMVGAVFTHLRHGEVPQAAVPFVLLLLLVLVGYASRPRTAP